MTTTTTTTTNKSAYIMMTTSGGSFLSTVVGVVCVFLFLFLLPSTHVEGQTLYAGLDCDDVESSAATADDTPVSVTCNALGSSADIAMTGCHAVNQGGGTNGSYITADGSGVRTCHAIHGSGAGATKARAQCCNLAAFGVTVTVDDDGAGSTSGGSAGDTASQSCANVNATLVGCVTKGAMRGQCPVAETDGECLNTVDSNPASGQFMSTCESINSGGGAPVQAQAVCATVSAVSKYELQCVNVIGSVSGSEPDAESVAVCDSSEHYVMTACGGYTEGTDTNGFFPATNFPLRCKARNDDASQGQHAIARCCRLAYEYTPGYDSCAEVYRRLSPTRDLIGTHGAFFLEEEVLCSFVAVPESTQVFAGQLFESYSLAMKALYGGWGYAVDAPRHEYDVLSWMESDFRYGRSRIAALALQASSPTPMLLVTCNLNLELDEDFLLMAWNPQFTVGDVNDCQDIYSADVRGHACRNGSAHFWSHSYYHFHLDSTFTDCECTAWAAGAVDSEDNFGLYIYSNPEFSCSASASSTTNYWMGVFIDTETIAATYTISSSCQAGQYRYATTDTCENCAPGSYNAYDGLDDRCYACEANTYQDVHGAVACIACPPGQHSNATGASTCVDCAAGTYSLGKRDACTQCPLSSFSAAGASECEFCGAGTHTTAEGAIECDDCVAGMYSPVAGGSCRQCQPGTYSDAPGGSVCSVCPAGKFSAAAAATVCDDCAAGTFNPSEGGSAASVCGACPANTFSEAAAATQCELCPAGQWAADSAAACEDCLAGQYSLGKRDACTPCPFGTHSAAAGANTCEVCPAGKYSDAGAAECSACAEGEYNPSPGGSCVACPAGSYSLPGAPQCTLCAPGASQAEDGAGACDACPEGEYSMLEGSPLCTQCPANTWSSYGYSIAVLHPGGDCNSGTETDLGMASTPADCSRLCLNHMAESGEGQCRYFTLEVELPGRCVMELEGCDTWQTNAGWNVYEATAEGSQSCAVCGVGTDTNELTGQSSCAACTAGSFNAVPGASCTDCAAGSHSSAGASACTLCVPGTKQASTGASTCDACPVGRHQSEAGATTCVECPVGSYADSAGSASCTLCGIGKSSAVGSDAFADCIACPPGQFNEIPGGTCEACPVGYTSPAGSPDCSDPAVSSALGVSQHEGSLPALFNGKEEDDDENGGDAIDSLSALVIFATAVICTLLIGVGCYCICRSNGRWANTSASQKRRGYAYVSGDASSNASSNPSANEHKGLV